ncbi:MAG TPA: glycosyltransferase family 1 protein [Gaiellaceae bacterium]|nr:glycosyltransferase family 1 protein [Gaiellaceae bacterium]
MRVSLLRDLPAEDRVSMEVFADRLAAALRAQPAVSVTETTVRNGNRLVSRFLRYPLVARRVAADVHHVIDQGYGDIAALLPLKRTLVTCHDLIALLGSDLRGAPRTSWVSAARFRWSVSFLRRVAHVVCDSESTRADVLELLGVPEERVSVVHPGVSPHFRPLERAAVEHVRRRLAGDRPLVLHVSLGQPYKNVDGALRAVAGLHAAGIPAVLARTGRPLSPASQRLAWDLGLDGSLVELGMVAVDRLVELYSACDVFFFPSFYEGFGLPVLEAMACGAPVVASDCPALAELIGEAGVLAPAYDVPALTQALARVLESPELAQTLRARGVERAKAYSWEQAAQAYAEIYSAVASAAAA